MKKQSFVFISIIVALACFGWGILHGMFFTPVCPICHKGDMVKPIQFGLVSFENMKKHPDVCYGGCEEDGNRWYCARCHMKY
jgi:hypothetical protein